MNFNSFFLFGRSYDAKFLGVGNFQFSSVFAFFIPLLTVFSNYLFLFNLWHFPHLGQRRGVVRAFLSFALFLYLLFSAVASLDFKYITDQRTPTNVHAFPAQFFFSLSSKYFLIMTLEVYAVLKITSLANCSHRLRIVLMYVLTRLSKDVFSHLTYDPNDDALRFFSY